MYSLFKTFSSKEFLQELERATEIGFLIRKYMQHSIATFKFLNSYIVKFLREELHCEISKAKFNS